LLWKGDVLGAGSLSVHELTPVVAGKDAGATIESILSTDVSTAIVL
jgi:hypothetical protein